MVPDLVPKSDPGYRRVQHQTLEMRRNGSLPWGWVVDHTRRGYHVNAWDDVNGFLSDVARWYRRDQWQNIPDRVEVWAESDSISGVLRSTTHALGVSPLPDPRVSVRFDDLGRRYRNERIREGPPRDILRGRPRPIRAGNRQDHQRQATGTFGGWFGVATGSDHTRPNHPIRLADQTPEENRKATPGDRTNRRSRRPYPPTCCAASLPRRSDRTSPNTSNEQDLVVEASERDGLHALSASARNGA